MSDQGSNDRHRVQLKAVCRVRLPRTLLLRTAATTLLLLIVVGPASRSPEQSSSAQHIFQTHNTADAVVLSDGSIVRAAPNTQVEIRFDHRGRSLHVSRGRAYFDVAHDSSRPFVVQTPVAVVHALGTRFGISIRDEETLVAVIEGSVSVTRAPSQTTAPQSESAWTHKLVASEQLRVSPQSFNYVTGVSAARTLAWATTIDFDEEPIHRAVVKFSQLSGVHLQLKDPGLSHTLRISGGFRLDDPEEFAHYVVRRASATVDLHRPGPVSQTITPPAAQPPK